MEESFPPVSGSDLGSSDVVTLPVEQPPSTCFPSSSPSLEPEILPPSIFLDSDFPPLICPRPYVNSSSPHSPVSSPSFVDPSLQKSLEIFTVKTPLSPSVLPLDSIRFENVTIRRKEKAPAESQIPVSAPYTPLSNRIKNAARHQSTSPHRVLRALTPSQNGSLCEFSH